MTIDELDELDEPLTDRELAEYAIMGLTFELHQASEKCDWQAVLALTAKVRALAVKLV